MSIKSVGIRVGGFGKIILTVTEDFYCGDDWLGMPNSTCKIRTRDAIPSDMIEIIKNDVKWES